MRKSETVNSSYRFSWNKVFNGTITINIISDI